MSFFVKMALKSQCKICEFYVAHVTGLGQCCGYCSIRYTASAAIAFDQHSTNQNLFPNHQSIDVSHEKDKCNCPGATQ